MKKTSLTIIAVAAMFAALSLTSCKKECEYYMEGKKCDKEVREKYYGQYIGTLTMTPVNGSGQTTPSTVTVEAHPDGPEYIKASFKLKLKTESTFDIPSQMIYSGNNSANIEGSGSFGQNSISMNAVWVQNNNNFIFQYTGNR